MISGRGPLPLPLPLFNGQRVILLMFGISNLMQCLMYPCLVFFNEWDSPFVLLSDVLTNPVTSGLCCVPIGVSMGVARVYEIYYTKEFPSGTNKI